MVRKRPLVPTEQLPLVFSEPENGKFSANNIIHKVSCKIVISRKCIRIYNIAGWLYYLLVSSDVHYMKPERIDKSVVITRFSLLCSFSLVEFVASLV